MTKTLALAALILSHRRGADARLRPGFLLRPGDGQEARRRRQDELHEEVRDGFLQCAGRRQEARRRRENLVHHQVREGWNGQLTLRSLTVGASITPARSPRGIASANDQGAGRGNVPRRGRSPRACARAVGPPVRGSRRKDLGRGVRASRAWSILTPRARSGRIQGASVDAVHSPSSDGRPFGRPMDASAALSERGYNANAARPLPSIFSSARLTAVKGSRAT